MNNAMKIDQMLNGARPREGYSVLPAAIRSPSPDRPASTSTSPTYAHKYSNSGASTASFASTASTHLSSSHSRNPSYSTTYSTYSTTHPETPPSAHSITGQFPSYCTENNFSSFSNFDPRSKMADFAEPVDELPKRAPIQYIEDDDEDAPPRSRPARRFTSNRTIDLTADDRADSPTDAVMPMMRRAPAGMAATAETSSPFRSDLPSSSQRGGYVNQNSPSAFHRRDLSSSSHDAAPKDDPDAEHDEAPAPIFGNVAQRNSPALRLDTVLIRSAVPRLYESDDMLMDEINFLLPRSCKFMEDCLMTKDLDPATVNWRKSMSHIFGRNKNCTRAIPDHVWMWVCRKHYQRARYRNTHEFNKKLIRMVELQILRLEAWSNYNRDRGMPQDGIVVNWTLEVRRREKMRIQETRKRKSMSDEDDEEDVEDEEEDISALATDAALVPKWLLEKTGPGKSTVEIQEIVARICRELDAGTLVAFPDIEILPNITGERAKPKNTRAKPANPPLRRRAPQPAPRRPASRDKRQRRAEEEYDNSPARRAAHLAYRPHPQGPGNVHYENDRYGYGPQPAAMPGAWPPRFIEAPRGYPDARAGGSHQRAFSMDSNAYAQQAMGYTAGYPEPANGYTGYAQAPAHGRDYMRDPAYVAQNLGQNGYWDADYYRQQQQAQQQAAYPQNDYMRTQAMPGAPQGGPPPVSAAKHSRNLSTPPRPRPSMTGHPTDGFGTAAQDARYDPASSNPCYVPAPAAAAGPGPAPAANMYGQPAAAPRYTNYNGLPNMGAPTHTGGENVPRAAAPAAAAAEYYSPAAASRMPAHGAAGQQAESYESAYTPARR